MAKTERIEDIKPGQVIQPYKTLDATKVLGTDMWMRRTGQIMVTLHTDGLDITRQVGTKIPTL